MGYGQPQQEGPGNSERELAAFLLHPAAASAWLPPLLLIVGRPVWGRRMVGWVWGSVHGCQLVWSWCTLARASPEQVWGRLRLSAHLLLGAGGGSGGGQEPQGTQALGCCGW